MKEFSLGTLNSAIFDLTAPYDNPYQGEDPRWLFVCSAGLLRSPTGARMAGLRGINARACGSAVNYALIPISANLIAWAHKIVFVCHEVRNETVFQVFEGNQEIQEMVDKKEIILDIPDIYPYMHPKLKEEFQQQLFGPQGF